VHKHNFTTMTIPCCFDIGTINVSTYPSINEKHAETIEPIRKLFNSRNLGE